MRYGRKRDSEWNRDSERLMDSVWNRDSETSSESTIKKNEVMLLNLFHHPYFNGFQQFFSTPTLMEFKKQTTPVTIRTF